MDIKYRNFSIEPDGTIESINSKLFSEVIKKLEKTEGKITIEKNFATTDLLQKLVNYLYENVGKNPIEETEVMLLKVLLDENK